MEGSDDKRSFLGKLERNHCFSVYQRLGSRVLCHSLCLVWVVRLSLTVDTRCAIKVLDAALMQGTKEFLKEVNMPGGHMGGHKERNLPILRCIDDSNLRSCVCPGDRRLLCRRSRKKNFTTRLTARLLNHVGRLRCCDRVRTC